MAECLTLVTLPGRWAMGGGLPLETSAMVAGDCLLWTRDDSCWGAGWIAITPTPESIYPAGEWLMMLPVISCRDSPSEMVVSAGKMADLQRMGMLSSLGEPFHTKLLNIYMHYVYGRCTHYWSILIRYMYFCELFLHVKRSVVLYVYTISINVQLVFLYFQKFPHKPCFFWQKFSSFPRKIPKKRPVLNCRKTHIFYEKLIVASM